MRRFAAGMFVGVLSCAIATFARTESAGAQALARTRAVQAHTPAAYKVLAAQALAPPVPMPLTGAPWTADDIAALRRDIDASLRAAPLRGAHVGLLAVDSRTGTVLYERNADNDFTPASTMKLITGATALARLGRDFHFRTTLLASAAPLGGIVDGDLILRGGGDPLLRRADLVKAAEALAGQGVRQVNGALIVDASYFDAQPFREGWAWDDLTQYYGVAPSALTLGESNNSATVTAPPTSAQPLVEGVSPDPALRAGGVLRDALMAHGITVAGATAAGPTPQGASVLWQRDGEPLAQLLADFWLPSDNLVGEELTKALGILRAGTPGRTDAGIAVELNFLRGLGIDTASLAIVDGSGLSRYNALTPRALVQLLQYEWNSPERQTVLDALPVAGSRGDTRNLFTGTAAAHRVYAKTGSMTNVTNMAGFIATLHHGPVTFAFLIDDALGDDAGIAGVRARIFARFIEA